MAASRKAFVRACAQYVPVIGSMKIDPSAASGVRAQAVSRDGKLLDDFAISHTPGATHVRNAPSPAATSSLALAQELVDRYEAAIELNNVMSAGHIGSPGVHRCSCGTARSLVWRLRYRGAG